MNKTVNVIGAGLAGCEAAWQAAKLGVDGELYEMKPKKYTPAHHYSGFAELVCSNSLKASRLESAAGLLKAEMRLFGSVCLEAADKAKVPAGGALAVDREKFTELIDKQIKENKNIVKPIEKVETKDEYKTQKPTENKIVETSTKPIDAKEKTTVLKNEFKEAKAMSGSWQSSEQGAFLTMDEYGYRIDFANVHASKPITGNYRIENNLIIFSSDSSDCENEDGTYRINFFKKNISLTCKSDNCVNRRNILEADWEWLEY